MELKNVHKIKLGSRYEFWLIHRQIFGTTSHIASKT